MRFRTTRVILGTVLNPVLVVVLRNLRKWALKTEQENINGDYWRKARLLLRLFYPNGGPILKITDLEDCFNLMINLGELEGRNAYFGTKVESEEMSLVKLLVESGDTFFDVGANIGLYTLVASRLTGETGSVHAFEPASRTSAILHENLNLNSVTNVVTNRLAVNEWSCEVEIYVNRESGLTSMGKTGRGSVMAIEKVPSISLDEYGESQGVRDIHFLKIDVEGFEGHVLRGGKSLLQRSRNITVICELSRKNFEPLGFSVSATIAWMNELGFVSWGFDHETRRLVPQDEAVKSSSIQNFVFTRPTSKSFSVVSSLSDSGVF